MQLDEYGAPVWTDKGVRCGSHGRQRVYHVSAEAVRLCYAVMRAETAQQRAEQEAEARNERWFEDRGYDEDYEQRMGMVDFQTAWDRAGR